MQPDCTRNPGALRRALAALLLVLGVLGGQSGVATHDLGHALAALEEAVHAPESERGDCDDGDGKGDACPLHALYTQLAAMAFGDWPVVALQAVHGAMAFPAPAPALAATRVAFRSRAPPVLPA